ncbi:LTA synthase family protein [Georgenia soli]|nr:LTA synthase family protein [Georgenia soli]
MAGSITAMLNWTDLAYFADLPVALAAIIASRDAMTHSSRRLGTFAVVGTLSAAVVLTQILQIGVGSHLSDRRFLPLTLSPVGFHVYDVASAVSNRDRDLSREDLSDIRAWLGENARYQAPDHAFKTLHGNVTGKNLIVVQIESLEQSLLGQRVNGEAITPNLNRLIGESIYFPNVVQQVKDGNTSDAMLLFNTSTYPLRSGSAFLRFPENNFQTLPKLLSSDGYTPIAIQGDAEEFWNRDRTYPSLGFSDYVSENRFEDRREVGMGIIDESLYKQSIIELQRLQEPFYLHLTTMTSHTPFELPEEMKLLEMQRSDQTSNYLQSVRYADEAFGEFYADLKRRGLLENSVLVVYGDHEGIHKYADSTWLPDNNARVPFIIHTPDLKGITVENPGGQVDMLPTLAYLFGFDPEEYAWAMGRNLLGPHTGSAILSSGDVLPEADDAEHLQEGLRVANLIISGDYFSSSGG